MNELFPLISGVFVGLVCGLIGSERLRATWCALASIVFGVLATVLSGEFHISWEFVLIDIPLVMAAALGVRALSGRWFKRRHLVS